MDSIIKKSVILPMIGIGMEAGFSEEKLNTNGKKALPKHIMKASIAALRISGSFAQTSLLSSHYA